MRHAIKSFTCGHSQAGARVVDGKLILSFPHALTPVVWQMDLTQAKASALEVHEQNGTFVLVLKTPRAESTDIAPFEKRAQAVEALMAVSKALENAQGQIRPAGGANGDSVIYTENKRRGGAGKWIAAFLGLFFLFVLFSMWGTMPPPAASGLEARAPGTAAGAPPAAENGVPLSADDFLNQQQSQQ
jgi:hypothetical protein